MISCFVSGEKGTLSHGSVADGRFEGFIKTHQGTYYIEPSERYLKGKNASFHSIIYHEDDISKSTSTIIVIVKTTANSFSLNKYLMIQFCVKRH